MIEPCGHRVLVRVEEVEEHDPVFQAAKKAGIAIPDTEDKARRQSSLDRGEVVKVGPTAFKDFGGDPWCKPGDFIAFAKYGGKIVEDPEDQKKYYILNDEDVIAVFRSYK